MSNGILLWTVRFDEDDVRDYDAESLADLVVASKGLGIDITYY